MFREVVGLFVSRRVESLVVGYSKFRALRPEVFENGTQVQIVIANDAD